MVGRSSEYRRTRYLGEGLGVGVFHGTPAPAQPAECKSSGERRGARASRSGGAVRSMGEVSDRGLRRLGAVRLATVTATPASESEAGDLWRFALCSGVESPSALAELFGADRAQLVRRVCGSTWRSEVLVKSKLRAANQFL
jgi:hypothetical protein